MAKARRDNGSGTIYQRENGTWQGRVYLGKKPDGTPKYKYRSGKSKTEVRRKIRELRSVPRLPKSIPCRTGKCVLSPGKRHL